MVKKLFILAILAAVSFVFYHEIFAMVQRYINQHEKEPWAPRYQYYLGNAYVFTRDYAEAEKSYLVVKKKYAQSRYAPRAQFMIARLYERREDYKRAKEEYERFMSEFPGHPLNVDVKYKLNVLSYLPPDNKKSDTR